MARTYIIRTGCSFRLADGKLKTGGEQIELDDDVATTHADKLEPLPQPEGEGEGEGDGEASNQPTPEA